MNARKLLKEKLEEVVEKLAEQKIEVQILPSEKSDNGDYYTNVAMRLSAILKKPYDSAQGKKPLDIAYEIKKELELTFSVDSNPIFSKVDVAPPGFVNFFLSEKYLAETTNFIISNKSEFGKSDSLKDQKIMIEFTDPNPFKEFHIGHLYSNIVGESLCRLFESQGATVRRVCYQGDVGLHVAKAIYGLISLEKELPDNSAPLQIRARFMGRAYALGATKYEEDKKIKEEIHTINKKVYDKSDKEINNLYKIGRAWSLEYFDSIYARLGTKFERLYFESEVGEEGIKLVHEFLGRGVFEESDGAIIFPGKKYGLHNRVFINSQGLPTYEAKDLGLAPLKYKEFEYDRSIIITAQEQAEYFKVILKALEQINPDLASKTIHISHGMVRLPSGKMSSRTGDVITGEWLIDEAVARIKKEFPEMANDTTEVIALAAIKYALLKSVVGRDIEFSFDESIALEGASGPYILYTYVRTQSVINKNKELRIKNKGSKTENTNKKIEDRNLNNEEKEVLRELVYFSDAVKTAQEKLSPSYLAEYLFVLSQKFNLFYQKHKIADNEFRLELACAVGITLKNGLSLMGIGSVEKM